MTRQALGALVAGTALLLLSACTSAQGGAASGGQTPTVASGAPTAESTSAPTATAEIDAAVGECFNPDNNDSWVIQVPAVDCAQPHTQQTVLVFTADDLQGLDASFSVLEELTAKRDSLPEGQELSLSDQAQLDAIGAALDPLFAKCSSEITSLIGGISKDGAQQRTVFATDITGPDQAQWDEGQRWARCNVVAKVRVEKRGKLVSETLLELPTDISDAARRLAYQYCWRGNGNTYALNTCAAQTWPKENGYPDAWLFATTNYPVSEMSPKYPGSREKAAQMSLKACRSFTRDMVRPDKLPLADDAFHFDLWNTQNQPQPGESLKTSWEKDGAVLRCSIPVWAFR